MSGSIKSLMAGFILLALAISLAGAMNLPLFMGDSPNHAIDSVFNSMRKGVVPPFKKLQAQNREYLGENYMGTLVFPDAEIAKAASVVLLKNKLVNAPDKNRVTIKGDLGYTLSYFLRDIRMLYYNRGKTLEQRYSMPPKKSMYVVNEILKALSSDMQAKNLPAQKELVESIRQKALIPSYNMLGTVPLDIVPGMLLLSAGTLIILIFAGLWGLGFIIILKTVNQKDFYHQLKTELASRKQKKAATKSGGKKKGTKNTAQSQKTSQKGSPKKASKKAPQDGKAKSAPKKQKPPEKSTKTSSEEVKKKKTAPAKKKSSQGTKAATSEAQGKQRKKVRKKPTEESGQEASSKAAPKKKSTGTDTAKQKAAKPHEAKKPAQKSKRPDNEGSGAPVKKKPAVKKQDKPSASQKSGSSAKEKEAARAKGDKSSAQVKSGDKKAKPGKVSPEKAKASQSRPKKVNTSEDKPEKKTAPTGAANGKKPASSKKRKTEKKPDDTGKE